MSQPAETAPPAAEPTPAAGGAEDDKDVVGADGKPISKSQQKKLAKLEEQAKKKAEKHKKAEEEKVSAPQATKRTAICPALSASAFR